MIPSTASMELLSTALKSFVLKSVLFFSERKTLRTSPEAGAGRLEITRLLVELRLDMVVDEEGRIPTRHFRV